MGAFAFAPHIADPRLSQMRCGWTPSQASCCGKVGRVIEVHEGSVKLLFCYGYGLECWWDIELFDTSLTRRCHHGCRLETRVVGLSLIVCDVCRSAVPVGAATRRCNEHNYDICGYCLGHPHLPPVGAELSSLDHVIIRTCGHDCHDFCQKSIM